MTDRLTRRLRTLWSDERGISMVELIVAGAIFMVMLCGVLSMVDSGTKHERGQQARHDALLGLRGALNHMTKDVRQAKAVAVDSTPSKLTIETLREGAEHFAVYEVANGELTARTCSALPCTGQGMALATHVASATPFCYDPPNCTSSTPAGSSKSIRIALAVEPEVFSGGPMTLATDVELRNM